MNEQPILYMVIPCYNEQEVLMDSAEKLKNKIHDLMGRRKISRRSKICFVNDGSKDKTWALIQELCHKDDIFSGICLAHNKGHQNAVTAGLLTVRDLCDIAISMDADLQDDIDAIDAMVDKYLGGCDIVYGVRKSRESDTFFKRFTAQGFYKFMQFMGADLIYNHADFRLMDRRALEAFSDFKEVNLFLRGMIPMIGLNHDCVYYERKERLAGESKYPLKKMIALAWQGITSLTNNPIGYILKLGLGISVVAGCVLIWSLVEHFTGATIAGWTSLIVSLWFLGGLILFSIGIVGEYIGKIYLEVKHRPRFIIQEFIDSNAKGGRGRRERRGSRNERNERNTQDEREERKERKEQKAPEAREPKNERPERRERPVQKPRKTNESPVVVLDKAQREKMKQTPSPKPPRPARPARKKAPAPAEAKDAAAVKVPEVLKTEGVPIKSDFVKPAPAPVEPAGAGKGKADAEKEAPAQQEAPAEEAIPYGPRIAYLRLRKEKLKNGRGRRPVHERRPFPAAQKADAKDGVEPAAPAAAAEPAERKQDN